MSNAAKENRNKFNKALNILNKESGANLSFVITESNDSFNGSIVNDKTLYIGEDQFEKGTWAETLIHEYTHLSEGSVDYVKLVDFLSSDDILVNDGNGGKIELWKKSQEAVLRKNYGIDSETIVKIQEKLKNGQALTASEQKIIDNFVSEFAAHETQYLLGNEDFIDKIVARDSSFAKKLLQKVENLKQAFKRVGNKEGQKAYKQLREAEKLYLKAAAKAGNMQIQRFILAHSPDLEKEIDVSTEIKYNFKGKKAVRYINNKLDTPTLNHIRSELSKIYGDVDSAIADGVAIAKDDTIYIVDSGRENGRIDFGVRKSITINDKQLRAEFLRRTNSDAIRKGYVSDELSSILRGEYDNDWGRDMRRELGEKLPSDKGEPKNNESRISGENGNNRRLKYSLKEGIDYAVKQNGKIYQQFDGSTEIKYNKKTSLIGKNFPPYNESFSEANTLATRWAHETDIQSGDQTAISFNNEWYLIEKFDDSDLGYQIIDKLTEQEYLTYEEEWNNVNRQEQSIQKSVSSITSLDRQRDSFDRRKSNNDSSRSQQRGENKQVQQVGGEQTQGRQTSSDRSGDSKSGGSSQQIKYSLKEDTNGKQLSAEQKEYFKDSKVIDKNGKLQVVYHGTEGDFYVYDKSLRSESTGAKDAKLGFFFTNSKMVALSYAINAYDNKMFTLKHKIANGDRNILEKLTYKNGYQDLAMTDDVKEFARLQDKGERLDHDIQELYLNIKNPLETDWKGKVYKNEAMLKIIKRALLLGNDGVIIRNIEDSFDNNFGISDVFVAFEPNQIKLTTNVNPTINEDIRFSLKESNYAERNPSTVTEKEFNHHYWAIASNLLSKKEIGTLNSSVAKLKNGEFFNKNADGFYLIPVGENGIYNKIVLTDGKFNTYSIDTVIEIQLDNETELSIARENIYARERNGIQAETNDLFEVYYSKDYRFSDFKRDVVEGVPNRNGEQDGTRSNREIKFSLKKDGLSKKYRYELSDGQIKKLLADKTKPKVYSKVETEETINMIVNEMLGIGEKFGSLTGKAKAEAVEMFWRGLNTAEKGKQMKVALDVAEYIIQNSALETLTDEGENYVYLDTINALKPYLHSIDLSALKGEIKYKFDTDNSAYLLWGKRKGERGLTADQVKTELAECGFIVKGDTEADIFFNMDSAYREATKALKKQTKEMLSSALSNEERKTLKNTIAKEVLLAFDKNGKPSTFSKILDQYHKEALTWKEKYYEAEKRNSEINKLLDSVQKIKNLKKGTFINASEYRTDIFKKSIDTLANIKFRGELNKSGTRDIAAGKGNKRNKKGKNSSLCKFTQTVCREKVYDVRCILRKFAMF